MKSGDAKIYRQVLMMAMAGLLSMVLTWETGCAKKKAATPPSPPRVSVAQPLKKNVTDYIEAFGNTQVRL